MLKALIGSGEHVRGIHVNKIDGPFACPACKSPVILKKGAVKIHHFAHAPPYTCTYGAGETEDHRQAKNGIYEALVAAGYQAWLELGLSPWGLDSRPDVLAIIDGNVVAIEVQASCLSMNEIAARTLRYHNWGAAVIWLSTRKDALSDRPFSPKLYEKYLHCMYFGKVYYWEDGLRVLPVHYGDHMLYVEESEFYSPEGELQQFGGYERRSKRWRTPEYLSFGGAHAPSLVENFERNRRRAWRGGDFSVPECTLWALK
jgi:competence protein CoiA